ncbi:MAG: endonuclease/exonuclease/phosphatase family protein [Flavobacteriales bacterium]|nr:endonuclease/exonuclease/phosphatase family protein [Flavobacteriales bacterium]
MKKLLIRKDRDVLVAALILTVATGLAFAPDAFLPMLARAFLLEWVLVFVIILAWAIWRRQAWTGAASAMACLMVLLQLDAPVAPSVWQRTDASLRVAQMNLLQPNRRHAEVVRLALESDADVISFQEVSEAWAEVLEQELGQTYPFHRIVPGVHCYGIALFSRLPVERLNVLVLEDTPVIEAVVSSSKGPVRVFSVHASSPGSWSDHRRRNAQLKQLSTIVKSDAMPTVVVGDLNTVGWDKAMWRLCVNSGLRIGTSSTSPTFPSLFGLALIPIDHLLVSPGAAVVASRTFFIPGSDHRGLIVDVAT